MGLLPRVASSKILMREKKKERNKKESNIVRERERGREGGSERADVRGASEHTGASRRSGSQRCNRCGSACAGI